LGESREGGGRIEDPTSDYPMSPWIQAIAQASMEVGEVRIQRLTDGTYAIDLVPHGEQALETRVIELDDPAQD
jgi:hypothetical protein